MQAINDSNDENFVDLLAVKKPVDVIIRSGAANLLSNFLPIQSGFARLYFYDKLFNDLTVADVQSTYQKFIQQNLKYGE
jgi:undecaprenyl diphosphate synthase